MINRCPIHCDALHAAHTYDAQGQRTKSVVTQGTLTTTTNFSYEDLKLTRLSAAQSGSGSGSWNLTYLYDESGDPYAGVYRSPGSSTTPVVFGMVVTDRGDVVELLDAAGTPFAAYRYDAWGNPQGTGNVGTGIWSTSTGLITSQVATEIAQRQVLRYASYCWDSLDQNDSRVGLYYLSARHYDPLTRQFLSKDLSRNDGEESAYQYCNGDPVNNVDPSGYWGMPKWLKKTLKVVQKVADVVSFIPIPGVSTIASLVSTGARIAVDAGEGGWARVKQNAKSYALDVALCATGGAGKVLSKGLGVVAKRVIPKVGTLAGEKLAAKTYTVYRGVNGAGDVKYYGITKRSVTQRELEHKRALGTGKEHLNYEAIEGYTGLAKRQARIAEQTFINNARGVKGGRLLNKINSVAPKYWKAWGIPGVPLL